MRVRALHRIIGVVLLIPFAGWAVTGLVFFIKPGYEGAYEVLSIKTYPLGDVAPFSPDPAWLEVRYFRTVLGDHLLARSEKGWVHLNPSGGQPRSGPTEEEVRLLLNDAFSVNPRRYGRVSAVSGVTAVTDTGVSITVDWQRLGLRQRGRDTERIDLLYRVHYLQWTGMRSVDRVVGLVGIVLVMALTALGARLALWRS